MDAKLNPSAIVAAPRSARCDSTSTLLGRLKLLTCKTGSLGLVRARLHRALCGAGHDELRGMNDQQLKDLGIGRSEIPHILGRDVGRAARTPHGAPA